MIKQHRSLSGCQLDDMVDWFSNWWFVIRRCKFAVRLCASPWLLLLHQSVANTVTLCSSLQSLAVNPISLAGRPPQPPVSLSRLIHLIFWQLIRLSTYDRSGNSPMLPGSRYRFVRADMPALPDIVQYVEWVNLSSCALFQDVGGQIISSVDRPLTGRRASSWNHSS